MKLFLIGLALLATVYGEYSSEYQVPQDSLAVLEEIETLGAPSSHVHNDGYRYKTLRRFRSRHRRDVNELVSPEYLPPAEEISYQAPSNEYLAPIASVGPVAEIASGVLADDGYRYKTVRRLRLRHRRDVNELASAQYLPPIQEIVPQAPVVSVAPVADIPLISNEYLAPLEQNENILADDGYRYKTVRRFKIRRH